MRLDEADFVASEKMAARFQLMNLSIIDISSNHEPGKASQALFLQGDIGDMSEWHKRD
jgi:hypothetical protein